MPAVQTCEVPVPHSTVAGLDCPTLLPSLVHSWYATWEAAGDDLCSPDTHVGDLGWVSLSWPWPDLALCALGLWESRLIDGKSLYPSALANKIFLKNWTHLKIKICVHLIYLFAKCISVTLGWNVGKICCLASATLDLTQFICRKVNFMYHTRERSNLFVNSSVDLF